MSPHSGLGSTHDALVNRLISGEIEGYELGDVHEYNLSNNPVKRLWRRWFSSPKKVNNLEAVNDIVHITDQEQGGLVPINGKSVVTVHDLFHLFPSKRDGIKIGDQKPPFVRRKDLAKIKNGLSRASLLICVSKNTQQECEMRFPGVSTAWIPHAINIEEYSIKTERPSWFNEGCNLLIVGSEEPRKRVDFAVQVCGGMDVTLHKIGAESSEKSKKELCSLASEVNCNLNWIGAIEQNEMIAALQHANALLFPSVAEGFGLPPLEAYAAGTVALVADAPAHNEIPLEHHILPHDDLEMWRTAITELKDESSDVKSRAEEFSIQKWAVRLKQAYNSLF
ncbi:MAG: glycosyltransferase [Candidatus Poseidoniaceae archaeon]|nr:glycosyltransferase [Candidatus Poseidoniaceae archaeon]